MSRVKASSLLLLADLFLAFPKACVPESCVIKGNTNTIDYAFTGPHNGYTEMLRCMLQRTFG